MIAKFIDYNYVPTEQEYNQALEFSQSADKYCIAPIRDNQTNLSARVLQHAWSKLSELACMHWLKSKGYVIEQGVDWNIYDSKNRSYVSDLVFMASNKRIKCGVKVSMCPRKGVTYYEDDLKNPIILNEKQHSYVFEKEDPVTLSDYYIFCNLLDDSNIWENKNKIIEVHAVIKSEYIKRLFVMPFFKKFWDTKRCIMMETCNGGRELPCGLDEFIKRHQK